MLKKTLVFCGLFLWCGIFGVVVSNEPTAFAKPKQPRSSRLYSLRLTFSVPQHPPYTDGPKATRFRLLAQKPEPPRMSPPPRDIPASKPAASKPAKTDPLDDIEEPPSPAPARLTPSSQTTTPPSSAPAPTSRPLPSNVQPPATREEAPLITTIHIIGLQRVTRTEVNRYLFSQEGDFFSREKLDKDTARLQKSGLFETVRTSFQIKQGLAEITFTLKERELILIREIAFVGNRILQAPDLQKPLELKVGGYFENAALKRDAHRILKAYSQIGYFRARLYVQGYWGTQAGRRTVKLEYVIHEDLPARIRRVEILGNQITKTADILAALASKPADFLTNFTGQGIYHPYYVAQDRYVLDNFFMDRGFLERDIKGPYLFVSRDRRQVDLRYHIKEGPIYRYNAIALRGELLGGEAAIRKILTIHLGKIFDRSELLDKTVASLRRHYQDAGYAFAKIEPIPLVDQQRKALGIVFRFQKGPLVRIANIEIVGNTETQDHVIRRRLSLKEGDLYSDTRLRQSQRRIFALGYFEKNDDTYGVQVQVEKTLDPDQVNLRFVVRERWTWTILPSFTYLPGYDAIFLGRVGKENFLGLGQSLSLTGVAATSGRLFSLSLMFFDPSIANSPLSLSFSGYFSYNAIPNLGYAIERLGGTLGLGIALGTPALRFHLSYSIGRYGLSPQENFGLQIQGFSAGSWLRSGVGGQLIYDDQGLRPHAFLQMRHSVSFFHIAPYLGANYSLNQLDIQLRFFLHFHKRVTLKLAGTLGWMFSFDPLGPPSFERYRLGGDRDMRGYPIQSLAPVRVVPSRAEATFTPVRVNWGGSKTVMGNAELEIVLARRAGVSMVLFYDAGNTYDDREAFFQDTRNNGLPLGLFMDVGFGIRWRILGAGLFRFEFGFPLNPRPGDPPVQFWVTIGESVF